MKATSRAPRIIGGIIKLFFVLLIVTINAIIIWRVAFSDNLPKSVASLTQNEALSAACHQHGDGLILQYQEQGTVTRGEKSYGYFGIPQVVFVPQANQVQIVFRYNNSTIANLAKDYQLPEVPSKEEHLFDVTLVKTVDLTPENRTDNTDPAVLQAVRYHSTQASVVRDTTKLYTYYRYTFDGISVDDLTVGVFADVYYVGDVDYTKDAYGTLCLYDCDSAWIPYKVTAADKKVLDAANKRGEG